MKNKTDKHFLFNVQLHLKQDGKGMLTAPDAEGTITVATPPEFGGEENVWSPEHLFLGSISSCFMTTYLAFSKKNKLAISSFECNAIGQIEIVNGKYKFTVVNVYPIIGIAKQELEPTASLLLDKSIKYCLVANSLNCEIFYHAKIIMDGNT
jgi:organic hydroperoxide reductase OsmC/OhrA